MRRRLAIALIVLGLLGIVTGVVYVLEAANGPGTGPKTFAQRRSYNQVKEAVHATFPLGLVGALAGLGMVMVGKRLLEPADPPDGVT